MHLGVEKPAKWTEQSPYMSRNIDTVLRTKLVPASFDVLWFKTDSAVFTLLTIPVCYICHHFAINIIMA